MATGATGLFALLNNDGSIMDSSIHPTTATLSNLSSLDTTLTFPPKKAMDQQTTILSPLFELAYSLWQVYVDEHFSHILNCDGSIFLHMDYHNTIRVFQLLVFRNESAQQYLAVKNRVKLCISDKDAGFRTSAQNTITWYIIILKTN